MRFCCGALWLEKHDKCFLSATVTQSRRVEFSWPHLLHVSLGLRLRQSCAGNRIALQCWVRAAADRPARILQLPASGTCVTQKDEWGRSSFSPRASKPRTPWCPWCHARASSLGPASRAKLWRSSVSSRACLSGSTFQPKRQHR